MGKFILIGAISGAIIGWIMNQSFLGLMLGIAAGILVYMVSKKRPGLITKQEARPPVPDEKQHSIQLREEELDIKKERVQTGEVKIHKEVVEEPKTITVPIKREEMVVEAGDEEELRIPLKEEEIDITKHPVKLNEVSISTKEIQEMKHIKEKIKKEIPDIEIKGEADVIEKE